MKELLLNERWRPKTLDDMIILPRIKNIFKGGLKQNVILYGHYGTGKTTLARILIGKWTKDKAFIEINNSYYTSIDTLRTTIDDFCSNVYMNLDMDTDIKSDQTKYVFLDEFERASIQYQDGLKAYIEDYSTKNVRFILNTNHLDKVSGGIKSRMAKVNFDIQSPEEEKFLKRSMFAKIVNQICPSENIEIERKQLINIINNNFPDFRSTLNELQVFSISGDTSGLGIITEEAKLKLYNIINSDNISYEDTFHFINDSFGANSIKLLLKALGSDYSTWCFKNCRENIKNLFEINSLVAIAYAQLENSIDPLVVSLSLIGSINKLKK